MCRREVEHSALLSEQKVSSPPKKNSMAKALSPAMQQVHLIPPVNISAWVWKEDLLLQLHA